MLKMILRWLTGGSLDKAFNLADKYIQSAADKEVVKADLIKIYYGNRADWMNSGGKWVVYAFAYPLALWYASVIFYSILFCKNCVFPQTWTIASLPPPLDQWSWMIIVSIFGVIGVSNSLKLK